MGYIVRVRRTRTTAAIRVFRTLTDVPRRKSLTLDGIAAAALAVLDRDGLGGLSMRSVATELGVGTMSLYRYVDSREDLEHLIVEHVLAGVDLSVSPRAGWRTKVRTLAERVRSAIGDHPAVVPILLSHRQLGSGTVRWAEPVLAALRDGGFEGKARVVAFRTLLAYVLGAVQVEHLASLSGDATVALADLPRDRFPVLAETAASARGMSADEDFRSGLDAVLRGLAG